MGNVDLALKEIMAVILLHGAAKRGNVAAAAGAVFNNLLI